MRKRTVVIGIILLLVVGIAGGLWWFFKSAVRENDGKLSALKPTVEVASMNITDIDRDKIKATSKIVLNNPYPIELKTNRVDYQVFIDSITVIKSSYNKPITVSARDSTVIELPLEILAKPMKEVFTHFEKAKVDSADYGIKASFAVDVPVAGNRTFNIDKSKRLPAILLPEMKPGKIDIDKIGLHESKLDMVMRISNPNAFALKMEDGRYTVTIDDNMKLNGIIEKVVNIPPKGEQDVSVSLDMKTANMGKLAWKMLFEKKYTRFNLHFNCKLLTDNDLLKNSTISMNAKGTLDELKQLAKNK